MQPVSRPWAARVQALGEFVSMQPVSRPRTDTLGMESYFSCSTRTCNRQKPERGIQNVLAERFPRSGAESAKSCQSALVSGRADIVSEIRAMVVQRDCRFAAERQGTHGTRLCNGITAVPGDCRLTVVPRMLLEASLHLTMSSLLQLLMH